MKTTLSLQHQRNWGGLVQSIGLSAVLLVVLVGGMATGRAASAAELLEEGIYTEETKGELKAAIDIYQRIADDPQADRRLVSQAQLRLGLCQLKLGNKPQAISALDRVTREFPDKDQLLSVVENQMPQLLDEIVQQIERNYILEVDRGELLETAIRAIVGKLETRGGFLRADDMEFLGAAQLKDLNVHLDQKLAGIGAVLKAEGEAIVIRAPMLGSPALTAGLRAGDRIVSIDGAAVAGGQLASVVQRLRGPVGSAVTIGIARSESPEVREFRLIRDSIQLPSVRGFRYKPDQTWNFMMNEQRKIGYIRLSQVGRRSLEEMRAALDELQSRDMAALIFDLRDAPGGLLDGAVAIADLFVEAGRILTVKGRQGEQIYDATPAGTYADFPIALLVNRRTASAAEIIAACLQDHQRAVVIGERTYGSGIVRSIFQLKSGVGAVKLPVAAYYRPNGQAMNRHPDAKESDAWGVRPNDGYAVVLTDNELKAYDQERSDVDVPSVAGGTASAPSMPMDRQMEKALEWIGRQGTPK